MTIMVDGQTAGLIHCSVSILRSLRDGEPSLVEGKTKRIPAWNPDGTEVKTVEQAAALMRVPEIVAARHILEAKDISADLWLEAKGVVRHVRTPAGKKRYGQPIGTIIVADGKEPLKNIVEAVSNTYKGATTVKGTDGNKYHVFKDDEDGKWKATGDDGDFWDTLVEADDEEGVYRALDDHVGGGSGDGDGGGEGTTPARERPESGEVDAADPADTEGAVGGTRGPTRRLSMDRVMKGHNVKGTGTSAGTPEDPINTKGDIMLAAKLLAEGKSIRLNKIHEVGTLLERLTEMVEEAQAKGDEAPTFDLCKVSMPKTNLFCAESKGIPRAQMPQLGGQPKPGSTAWDLPRDKKGEVNIEEFFAGELKKRGIKVETKNVKADFLKASQAELDGPKVAGMSRAMAAGKVPDKPIYVTRDGYIIDGHHRWASKVSIDSLDGELGDIEMPVHMVDMEIGEALDFTNAFALGMGIIPKGLGAAAEGAKWLMDAILRARPELRDVEVKVVRHVRTQAGVRKFKQPIGSVIVRDGLPPLNFLRAMPDGKQKFEGADTVQGEDGKKYHIFADPDSPKDWYATSDDGDFWDTTVGPLKSEEAAYTALDEHVAKSVGKKPAPAKKAVAKKAPAAPVKKAAAKKTAAKKPKSFDETLAEQNAAGRASTSRAMDDLMSRIPTASDADLRRVEKDKFNTPAVRKAAREELAKRGADSKPISVPRDLTTADYDDLVNIQKRLNEEMQKLRRSDPVAKRHFRNVERISAELDKRDDAADARAAAKKPKAPNTPATRSVTRTSGAATTPTIKGKKSWQWTEADILTINDRNSHHLTNGELVDSAGATFRVKDKKKRDRVLNDIANELRRRRAEKDSSPYMDNFLSEGLLGTLQRMEGKVSPPPTKDELTRIRDDHYKQVASYFDQNKEHWSPTNTKHINEKIKQLESASNDIAAKYGFDGPGWKKIATRGTSQAAKRKRYDQMIDDLFGPGTGAAVRSMRAEGN